MLDKIINNCMGSALYNGIANLLNGKTLTIEFNNTPGSSFSFDGSTAGISLGTNMESNHLFHEMWHVYQAYGETTQSFRQSVLNLEVEAFYAQYLYVSILPEFNGSKWENWYLNDPLMGSIQNIEDYVNPKGNLKPGKTNEALDLHILNGAKAAFETRDEYRGKTYDYNRTGLNNFKNMKELTKNCP